MALATKRLFRFGPFRLDAERRLLLRGDEAIGLRPRVFDTLLVLAERAGEVVSKDELLDAVWPDTVVEENNLSQNILALRRVLEEHGSADFRIETVPRRGYRLIGRVEEELAPPRPTLVPVPPPIVQAKPEPVPSPVPVRRSWKRLAALVAVGALAAGTVWLSRRGSSQDALRRIHSLAVLPLRPILLPPDQEFLGLALADAVITRLGYARSLTVRPTSAVRSLSDGTKSPVDAGRALRVDAVLDGRIQQSAGRTRVTVQLIDVSDGRNLWSQKFDVETKDLFTLEDSIAESVAGTLAANLSEGETKRVGRDRPAKPEAYEAYLRGRFFWNQRNEAATWKAHDQFERAIGLDPNYALAYAGLADTLNALQFRVFDPARARAAAEKALSLDDKLAEAHASLGNTSLFADWNFAEAEKHFRRAIDLNPSYATAHQWYAYCFLARGNMAGALAEVEKAETADPLSPSIGVDLSDMLYFAGRYDESIAAARRVLELDPGFGQAEQAVARALLVKGDLDGAKQAGLAMAHLGEAFPDSYLAILAARRGDRGQAEELLGRVANPERWITEAAVAVALGDKDRALAALEDGFRRRDGEILILGADPQWDPMRSDPRFIDLLRRIGVVPLERARL